MSRLAYLHDYSLLSDEYTTFELKMDNGHISDAVESHRERLEWFAIGIHDDVWYTLNDKIGMIDLGEGQKISFEGFIKLVDLLFQNEDCKYYYKNVVINKKTDYKYDNGRVNSAAANLLILNYLEGNVKISRLLDSFQKSRGVPSFRKSDYSIVTDGMIINLDIEEHRNHQK